MKYFYRMMIVNAFLLYSCEQSELSPKEEINRNVSIEDQFYNQIEDGRITLPSGATVNWNSPNTLINPRNNEKLHEVDVELPVESSSQSFHLSILVHDADSNGQMTFYQVRYYPDDESDWERMQSLFDTRTYSGLIQIWDMDNEMVLASLYEDGEVIKYHDFKESGYLFVTETHPDHTFVLNCMTVTTYRYIDWYVNGDYSGTDFMGTTVSQTCDMDFLPMYSPSGFNPTGDYKYGGSSSRYSNCTDCVHEIDSRDMPIDYFLLEEVEGDFPINQYANKCDAVIDMWNEHPNNEVYGYLTQDGKVILTNILSFTGGKPWGLYQYNGQYYYSFKREDYETLLYEYEGIVILPNSKWHLIPVVASIHTHPPCREDGTNGLSHNVGEDDMELAQTHPGINHWVIGCDAIGQFGASQNTFFGVSSGSLGDICNNIH